MKNPLQALRNKIQALLDNLYFDNGLLAILQRSPLHQENLLVYRKERISFLVDFAGGDASGTRTCLTSDMYSRHYGRFDRNQPLCVLDLGANGGGFPLSLFLAGFTFSKLVCVEMNRNTCTRLSFNLHYNIPGDIVIVNAAVAGRSGIIKIPVSRGGTGESIHSQSAVTAGEWVDVPLITLDEITRAHFGPDEPGLLDICKIDIERAEHDVFQSPACTSIRRFRHLIIEIHPHKTVSTGELVDKICSLGFIHLSQEASGEGTSVHFFQNKKATA